MTTDLYPELLYKAEEEEKRKSLDNFYRMKKKEEICANCGHGKSWHFVGRDGEMKCRFPHPKCLCKKFVPKERTYNEVAHDVLEGELTKRAEEICDNCGHEHYIAGLVKGKKVGEKLGCSVEGCPCKKYKAKRKAIVLNDAEGYYKSKEKAKNHSPKVFIERAAKLDKKGIRAVCGTDEEYDKYVKDIKKPKNHSQELLPVQRGTDVSGKRLKPADTPSVKPVSVVNLHSEGTSTLSDKKVNLGYCYAYKQPDVKEAIKRLKDEIESQKTISYFNAGKGRRRRSFLTSKRIHSIIDKIMGEDLVK